jgi:ubiquinone/menaquinone biosynthesis C-methylase UbiE
MGSRAKLQEVVDKKLSERKFLHVLEAGCGSINQVIFRSRTKVAGIDISRDQLLRNDNVNYKIQGDLLTFPLQQRKFDVVVCWDVLEHLDKPRRALDSLLRSLKDDGLLILKMPNPLSVKGLLTKFTPHSFHIMYYKVLRNIKNAGKNDKGPFKTHLKFSITPNSLKKFAQARQLNIVTAIAYDVGNNPAFFSGMRGGQLIKPVYKWVTYVFNTLSFGLISESEQIVVFAKERNSVKRLNAA